MRNGLKENVTTNKRLDIELMRIVAAFFVIFNHTGEKGFFLFSTCDEYSIQYWLYLFLSVFCKFSVPLFFMISGALLLDRQEEDTREVLWHRVLHTAGVLLVWSFFYAAVQFKQEGVPFNIYRFFSRLYDSTWNFSFWYLYSYIAFLVSLPLLRRFAQNLRNSDFFYILILYVVFEMVIPVAQYLTFLDNHKLNEYISIGWIASDIVIFPLTGYFLSQRLRKFWDKKRKIAYIWMLNVGTIFLACFLTFYRSKITGLCDEGNSQVFHDTFVLINSATIFVTCQYLNDHFGVLEKWKKPLVSLGSGTLGIYLLHLFLRDLPCLNIFMKMILEATKMPLMLCTFVYCGINFMCGYSITMILRKIPIVRKFVS